MSDLDINLLSLDDGNDNYDDFELYESDDDEHHYDALNELTFGDSGELAELDWEREHENYSKSELSSTNDNESNSHTRADLSDSLGNKSLPFTDIEDQKENEINLENSLISSIWRVDDDELRKQKESENFRNLLNKLPVVSQQKKSSTIGSKQVPKNIMSVEELEKQLHQNHQQNQQLQQQRHPYYMNQGNIAQSNNNVAPQPIAYIAFAPQPKPNVRVLPAVSDNPLLHYSCMPNMATSLVQQKNLALQSILTKNVPLHHRQPGILTLPKNTSLNPNSNPNPSRNTFPFAISTDPDNGLLTDADKQWLLKVQFAQLNTLTPFIDDYYYYAFQESRRKANEKSTNQTNPNNRHRNKHEEWHLIKHRMYTSITFKNSLGQLPPVSFLAPRKILEFDSTAVKSSLLSPNCASGDVRRFRSILLEIENFLNRLIYYEDLMNPLMVLNFKRQKDLVEKQHLREIETAVDVEEALNNFQKELQESSDEFEAPETILNQILTNILLKERISSFLMIRKGKNFILRLLKHLQFACHSQFLVEFWRIFLKLNLVLIWKRDELSHDNLMIHFYQYFKRFINGCDFIKLYHIISLITEPTTRCVASPSFNKSATNSGRYTPVPFAIKPQIHFLLSNQFGISCITSMMVRVECLVLSNQITKGHMDTWNEFLVKISKIIVETHTLPSTVEKPCEPIAAKLMEKILNRLWNLDSRHKEALVDCFVD